MVFETIDIFAEASRVVELNNFTIILGDTVVYDVSSFNYSIYNLNKEI